MRIVGGIYKGRVLCPFEKIGVRPTSDMTRESLFNIIRDKIVGAKFLDLFAGTGAVGIEALSRGAAFVVINDSGREAVSLVRKNLEKLKIEKNIKVVNFDALRLIEEESTLFDIIYIDPPYKDTIYQPVLDSVGKILSDDGFIIVESENPLDYMGNGLVQFDRRKYGRSNLSFYKKGDRK